MGWVTQKRARVAQAVRILRERKREKLARVAAELGYSYHYFRYSVLPELLAKVSCFDYDRLNDELVWVCDDGEGVEAGARG